MILVMTHKRFHRDVYASLNDFTEAWLDHEEGDSLNG